MVHKEDTIKELKLKAAEELKVPAICQESLGTFQ
jgi:hypothetical protein